MTYPDHIWSAVYDDGTIFPQFEPGSQKENAYKDIDRKRLRQFVLSRLVDAESGEYANVFRLDLLPGQSLFYRRRNLIKLDGETKKEQSRSHLYLVGYVDLSVSPPKIVIAYVRPDGYVELSDDRSNVELLPFEEKI